MTDEELAVLKERYWVHPGRTKWAQIIGREHVTHLDAAEDAEYIVPYLVAELEARLAENAALREIVEAVARAESYHAELIDVWVLLLDNPTLSYAQELLTKARTIVSKE